MAVLDPRMFRQEAYISDDKELLQVQTVTTRGKFPNRKRTILAENVVTEDPRKLTETDLIQFHWVDPQAA